jgi:hypothetical protein
MPKKKQIMETIEDLERQKSSVPAGPLSSLVIQPRKPGEFKNVIINKEILDPLNRPIPKFKAKPVICIQPPESSSGPSQPTQSADIQLKKSSSAPETERKQALMSCFQYLHTLADPNDGTASTKELCDMEFIVDEIMAGGWKDIMSGMVQSR